MIRFFKRGKWAYLLAALVSLVALFAVACGGDDDDDDGTTPDGSNGAGGIDYDNLSGELRIDGSSTVFPIAEAAEEEFRSEAKDVRVNVALSGTGGGFEKFCRGETVISNASRPIKTGAGSETEKCTNEGIEPVEFKVAIDALTVVVSPQNSWAKCMTVEQLNSLYKEGGAKRWRDIDPSWPNDEIEFYYPGADSGTFDYFNEAIIGAVKGTSHRSDGTSSEDDDVLVRGVEGDKNAIGYFGFAYFQEAGERLNAVEVDGGDGCTGPSIETARAGTYQPLSRPLFMYTSTDVLTENKAAVGFLNFILDNQEDLNTSVGYIPLTDADLAAAKAKLEPYLNQPGR